MNQTLILPLTACLLVAIPAAEAGSGFAITVDVVVDNP
jgi:hypothetical protein